MTSVSSSYIQGRKGGLEYMHVCQPVGMQLHLHRQRLNDYCNPFDT
jgi:hypothetical protein